MPIAVNRSILPGTSLTASPLESSLLLPPPIHTSNYDSDTKPRIITERLIAGALLVVPRIRLPYLTILLIIEDEYKIPEQQLIVK